MSEERIQHLRGTQKEFFGSLPTEGPIRFQQMRHVSYGGIEYTEKPFEAMHGVSPKLVAPGEWAIEGVIGPGALLIVVDKDTLHPDIWVDYCFLGMDGFSAESVRKIPKLFSPNVDVFILGVAPHGDIDSEGVRERLTEKVLGQMNSLNLHADLHAFWNPVRNSWMDMLLYNSRDGFVEARLDLYTE